MQDADHDSGESLGEWDHSVSGQMYRPLYKRRSFEAVPGKKASEEHDAYEERIEPTTWTSLTRGRPSDTDAELHTGMQSSMRNGSSHPSMSQLARIESINNSDRGRADYEAVAYEVRAMLNPTQGRDKTAVSRWEHVRDMVESSRLKGKRTDQESAQFSDVYSQASNLRAAVEAIDRDDAEALRSSLASYSRSRMRTLLVAATAADEQSCDLLLYAVRREKCEAVEALVALGGEELVLHSKASNQRTMSVETCLHVAVRSGSIRMVRAIVEGVGREAGNKLVLQETVMPDRDERVSVSALHLAAIDGHVGLIDYLVSEWGVPVDLPCGTRATALYLAAMKNQPEVVRRLLALDAQTTIADRAKMTFLHYAILSGDKDMVELCLQTNRWQASLDRWKQSNPLLLAVYEDRADVVSALLEAKEIRALVNEPSQTYGHTALHVACREGKDSSSAICHALLACGADVLASSKQGETPWATAVSHKKVKAMVALAKYFVPPRCRYFQSVSASGQTIWDYAMNSRSSRDVLIALLEIALHSYQAERNSDETSVDIDLSSFLVLDKEAHMTTPLHIAVKKGDTEHLQLLLKYMPANAVDANGDTFLHVAARQGCEAVLRDFVIDQDVINQVNRAGDTVLHAACQAHQWGCAQILLPFSDTSAVNSLGQTALHELCKNCTSVNYVLLKHVIQKTTENSWDKLILRDQDGKTALHWLAAHNHQEGSTEKLFKLFHCSYDGPVPCNIANNDGNTPIHVAVSLGRTNNLKAMLSVFRKNADVNSMNRMGRTPLHLAAELGVARAVESLLVGGADVTLQDKLGDTPIHTLIRRAGREPTRTDACREVLLEILRHAHHQDSLLRIYTDGAETLRSQPDDSVRTYAVILLRMLENRDGLTPLFYAVQTGSDELLKLMLTLDGAFRLNELSACKAPDQFAYYDVTDLVPETVTADLWLDPDSHGTEGTALVNVSTKYRDPDDGGAAVGGGGRGGGGQRASRRHLMSAVKRRSQQQRRSRRQSRSQAGESLVEFILADVPARGHLLELTPLDQLTADYWAPYMIVYLALMFVHVVCMALFSWQSTYVLSQSPDMLNCSAVSLMRLANATSQPPLPPPLASAHQRVTLIMIWPLLIVLSDIVSLVGRRRWRWRLFDCRRLAAAARRQMSYVRDTQPPMFWLLGVAFSWTSLAWYALNMLEHCQQDYALCVALVTGWLYTIHFTQGIRSVHHFSLVLGRILMRDIWQFGVVFIFVLLGYSFGFHALTLALPSQRQRYEETVFLVFSWGAGMGEFYGDGDATYASAGKSKDFVEAVYVTYVIALNIILLNMLIAVMNDSYTAVRESSAASWRLGSLRRAVEFERQHSRVSRLVRRWRKRDIAVDARWPSRFYLEIAEPDGDDASSHAAAEQLEELTLATLTERVTAAVEKALSSGGVAPTAASPLCDEAAFADDAAAAAAASRPESRACVSTYLGRSNMALDRSSSYQRSAFV